MAEKNLSRRDMLRKIGIAGAVAWTVPMLASMPAAEASTDKKKNLCKHGGGDICTTNTNLCGSCDPDGLGGSFCFDTKGNDNKVFCGADQYCSELAACGKGIGKCPAGYKCSYHNGCTPGLCGETAQGVCIAVCKQPVSGSVRHKVVRRRTGRTTRSL